MQRSTLPCPLWSPTMLGLIPTQYTFEWALRTETAGIGVTRHRHVQSGITLDDSLACEILRSA